MRWDAGHDGGAGDGLEDDIDHDIDHDTYEDLDAAPVDDSTDLTEGDLDDGPGVLATSAAATTPWRDAIVTSPPPRRRRRRVAVGVAVLAIAGTGLAVALASRNSSTSGVASPPTASPTTSAAVVLDITVAQTTGAPTTAPTTTAAATTTAVPASTTAPTTTTVAPVGDVAAQVAEDAGIPNLYTPVRWAIFQGGRVRLLGRVPSRAVADTIAAKAGAVVGPENVTVEYVIDPSAPVPPAAPLYVRDTVQFAPGSDAVSPQFRPLLDLGVLLMQQNPGVRIWVLGRADNQGDPQANLFLSLRRSQAVMAYLVRAGIDESRLFAVPLGTDAALGDNATAEGRQQNRSVEFVISGLLS